MEGEAEVLKIKLLDTFVYYKPRKRFGACAIMINRKSLGRPRSNRSSAVKNAHVQRSSTHEEPSSAAPELKNKNTVMDIVLDATEGPVADTDISILEGTLQKYCSVFKCSFQELPDHFKQCSCDAGMNKDLVLTDPPYNIRRELGHQASDYDLSSNDAIFEVVDMCGEYPKLDGHAHISCFLVQLSS